MPEGSEKRQIRRAKRRVMVRFGTRTPDKTAFTKNLSETGMFLQTNTVFKPGTTIQVQAEFPDLPPQLAHILGSGMGVCFIDPAPDWLKFYHHWAKDSIRS
jgi:hypothetical protein